MSIAVEAHLNLVLPDTPYALWARGELDGHLDLPHERTRVEIIGGEIVVSPAPAFGHGGIVQDVVERVTEARLTDPAFPWRCVQGAGLDVVSVHDGYVPDLMLLDAEVFAAARRDDVLYLVPDQVELVLEVTSPSNAGNDRPGRDGRKRTKWAGYARAEIPYYLLVDRDPAVARVTLYSIPDPGAGAYLHRDVWDFGETVRLPDPFGLDVPTAGWRPWA
ncbi:Uma2 family endonuclease [Actinomadura craniellae]|uniref:Uma2 family endonuclease n=1 Tax=Actinomadura craniellae TaxID=2231787 RepID=UPI001313DACC|nr:Uma2 family endonuclease [Actinomadura craniellae]